MAGLGRRTHYRKHLTDAVLFDLPEPNADNERIAKVVATRGSNQFDVRLATNSDNTAGETEQETVLAILPTKFRKLVWVKRNDYVIVQYARGIVSGSVSVSGSGSQEEQAQEQTQDNGGGIRFMITHILYKDQIQHLTTKGLWPTHDPEFETAATTSATVATTTTATTTTTTKTTTNQAGSILPLPPGDDQDDDGIVYEYQHDKGDNSEDDSDENNNNNNNQDDLLFVNTNRIANIVLEDSSSEEEEEE